MENFENKPEIPVSASQNPSEINNPVPRPHYQHNPIVLLVVLSLIFGMLGGSLSTYYLLRGPDAQKSAGVLSATQNITLNEDSAIIDVVKKASPAVVSIIISQDLNKVPGYGMNPGNTDPFYFFFGGRGQQQYPQTPNIQEVGAGSGFFVSADGLILTNKHVVSDTTASYTVITSDGKSYDAKVMSQDPVNDLAIIKINIADAPFLTLADSSKIQIGQRVVAIGNSLGQYQNTVTSGIISGTSRSITAGSDVGSGSEQLSGVIQTDAAINPGNSGGPLLNIQAQVIGINTAIDDQGQLVGFALPSSAAQRALASFQKNGHIAEPFLGVRYVMITDTLAKQQKLAFNAGALIVAGSNPGESGVVPGSPAAAAGLAENDIILAVNGTEVNNDNTLSSLLQTYGVGDTVTLRVYHQGKEKDVKVTLGEAK